MSEETASIILFAVLLLLSAFFSGSETAIIGSRRITLENLSEKGSSSARRVLKLLDDPGSLLGTILVGNNLVNVGAAVIAVNFLSPGVATIAVTLLLLLVGEIPPKTLAAQRPEAIARVAAYPISVVKILFWPIVWMTGLITNLMLLPFSKRLGPRRRFYSQDEIRIALDNSEDAGVLEPGQAQMAQEILDFTKVKIRDMMIPAKDAAILERDWPLDRVLATLRLRRFTRYPVYHPQTRRPFGMLHIKDLLLNGNNERWQSMIRRLPFRSHNMEADDLLRDMQIARFHMAAVIDDESTVIGFITMERILEEIVGEIADEHDLETDPVKNIDEGIYRVRGDLEVADIERILNVDMDITDDEQTLDDLYRSMAQDQPISDIIVGPILMKPSKYGYLIQIVAHDGNGHTNGNEKSGDPEEADE
jgi:CBS domain containing-hemolysin-like protein